nr:hypothetical protein [Micromonospora rosaria]
MTVADDTRSTRTVIAVVLTEVTTADDRAADAAELTTWHSTRGAAENGVGKVTVTLLVVLAVNDTDATSAW